MAITSVELIAINRIEQAKSTINLDILRMRSNYIYTSLGKQAAVSDPRIDISRAIMLI